MSTLVELKYDYDRASNRKYRLDEAATNNSQHFDERYGYDGLNRLTAFDRGQLDVNGNNLTNATLGQTWSLDPTGNWNAFTQTVTGAFSTTRTHTKANEIESIATPTGSPTWATPPDYDDNGNMTEFPQPNSLGSSYVATYDAWNRLVKLEDGGTVAEYEYDGMNRRITKTVSSTVRHYYFSDRWQVLEERTGASTSADHQYVWGLRYVDDLVLRDRTSERLYALQDALFNVVALTDDTGDVKERFAYQPYGQSASLNPNFTTYSGTDYEWEYRLTGRELDLESGLQLNRMRYLHLELGRWLTRDPIGYDGSQWNLYEYARSSPTVRLDPTGKKSPTYTVGTRPDDLDDIKACLIGLLAAPIAIPGLVCAVPAFIDMWLTRGKEWTHDKWAHCTATCHASKTCSSPLGFLGATSKELLDCLAPGDASVADIEANKQGASCAGVQGFFPVVGPAVCWFFGAENCEDCCARTYPRFK